MENLKVGEKRTITVTIDATMTGLNSGAKVRVILPNGDKIWLKPEMLEDREEE